ncbi:MAG: hypothetical protein HRU31_13680 [Rhodobacteraceae bacterium]|nr:hypothetical protein [Paracoccaceae bacterium]
MRHLMEATWTGWRGWRACERQAERPAQARTKAPQTRQPVFIHDAITPYQGSTLLLAMLNNPAQADEDDAPQS